MTAIEFEPVLLLLNLFAVGFSEMVGKCLEMGFTVRIAYNHLQYIIYNA